MGAKVEISVATNVMVGDALEMWSRELDHAMARRCEEELSRAPALYLRRGHFQDEVARLLMPCLNRVRDGRVFKSAVPAIRPD